MQAKQFFFLLTKQNLGQRFGANKMHLSPAGGLSCCPFQGSVSVVVVDLLFDIPAIVCGGSVLVFVLVCITCMSFLVLQSS